MPRAILCKEISCRILMTLIALMKTLFKINSLEIFWISITITSLEWTNNIIDFIMQNKNILSYCRIKPQFGYKDYKDYCEIKSDLGQ